MRRVLLALAIAGAWALAPISLYADSGLTELVNAAYFPRTTDAGLHDIAHQRAIEIASDFSHNGIRPGTAEVLAWNAGYADPIAEVLSGWAGSPDHNAILSDPSLTLIGCATHVAGGATYAACVLSWGDSPPPQQPVPQPPAEVPLPAPILLPNTAVHP